MKTTGTFGWGSCRAGRQLGSITDIIETRLGMMVRLGGDGQNVVLNYSDVTTTTSTTGTETSP
jgi:hypothetical protein